MEWAQSITVKNGELVALVGRPGAQCEHVPVQELGRRGLPTSNCPGRVTLEVDFFDWVLGDTSEYLAAFGGTAQRDPKHHVFRCEAGGHVYLIPALALMRALFRPTGQTLPEMFRPQGIDRICVPAIEPPGVAVTEHWSNRFRSHDGASLIRALAWMYLCPSARAMADSVHDYARSGEIGLRLPAGRGRLTLSFTERNARRCVTIARIAHIVSPEARVFGDGAPAGHVILNESASPQVSRSRKLLSDPGLLPRSDGALWVSDEEWADLKHLFKRKNRTHCPRALLDGIIAKLVSGISWDKAIYRAGTRTNAEAAFRRWKKAGLWEVVTEVLIAHRALQ